MTVTGCSAVAGNGTRLAFYRTKLNEAMACSGGSTKAAPPDSFLLGTD